MHVRVPYSTWLLHQTGRDDPVGDVARDVALDVHIGTVKHTWSWRQIFRFIRTRTRDRVVLRAVTGTITEWRQRPYIESCALLKVPGVYCVSYAALPQLVKIGRAKNIRKRINSLSTGAPGGVILRAMLSADPDDEGAFHKRFEHHRFDGEWFHADLLRELE